MSFYRWTGAFTHYPRPGRFSELFARPDHLTFSLQESIDPRNSAAHAFSASAPAADRSQGSVDGADQPTSSVLLEKITSRNSAAHTLSASASAAGSVSGLSMPGHCVAFDTKEQSNENAVPYISTKHVVELHNFNGKATIINENEVEVPIFCRYLATKYILLKRQQPSEKVYVHELYKDPDAIKQNMPENIEELYQELLQNSNEKHIIPNDNFDHFLASQAGRMAPGHKKQFLVETSNHSMACELHYTSTMSEDGCKNTYVVRFFDPNKTDVVTRCEVSKPGDFIAKDGDPKTHALRNFIGDHGYQAYFQEDPAYPQERECIVYDCSDPTRPDPIFKTLEAASKHGVSAIMLYHLMCDGRDPDAFQKVAQHLGNKNLSFEELIEVLTAKCSDGTPGLFMALKNGHDKVIEAYLAFLHELLPMLKELLEDESEEYLKELLAAKCSKGVTGLYAASLMRHAKAMESYGKLLDILTLEKRGLWLENLLAVRGSSGMTGMEIAILAQQEAIADEDSAKIAAEYTATVAAYEALLDKLLPGEISDSLITEFWRLQA